MPQLILLSVFVIATCGLVYELLAGTLASYLLGDSVLQFSTVIGTYLFAMGVGSWFSKFVVRGLLARFIQLQIMVGLLGGLSAPLLFLTFGHASAGAFRLLLYLVVFLLGMLVGLEIPLILRILKDRLEFRDLVSQVLALDYIGALLASVLFPMVLVPYLGLIRTACFFGLINVAVALVFLHTMRSQVASRAWLGIQAGLAALVLVGCFAASEHITRLSEEALYTDEIILTRDSPYQRMVLTRHRDDLRLYLNNNLQFSSQDEYRYHEALVQPALASAPNPRRVLLLGGGDGLAAREVLRDPRVQSITLVDLDPEMTRTFATHPLLTSLNEGSLTSPQVRVVNQDAFIWLEENPDIFDVILVDFPDPSNFSLGKLYTTTFYRRLRAHLAPDGACAIQCTSPMFARRSFWCIVQTLADVGFQVRPYHTYVPSFGEWGFCLATTREVPVPQARGERYLTPATCAAMFEFPADIESLPVEVNHLYNQALVRYYDAEWRAIIE
ncbi:MAG: polyamine aminopropyltransferase [Candidatus Xenobium sp.]|jgi:spermidine synthase|nr:polyamine aminopropyltransferase [Burkholderiales bacterium]